MMKGMGLALAAVMALAAPVSAQAFLEDTTISIGGERHNLDVNAVGTRVSGALNGAYLRYEVDKDNGFETNTRIFFGKDDGFDYLESSFDVSWKWRDMIGPKLAYAGLSVDGFGEEYYLAGLTAAHRINNVELRADLLSDTENFGDDAYISVGAEWDATDKLELGAKFSKITSTDIHTAGVTAKYHMNPNIFLEGAFANTEPLSGVKYNEASVGIGFAF